MEHTREEHTPTRNDLSIPIAIVFSGILIAGAIIFTDKSEPAQYAAQPDTAQQQADTNFPENVLQIKNDDHVIGDPNANIVIIEYSDVQCPYCQRFHETMGSVLATYTDVAWVYRHFPLDGHPYAQKGAEALECASEQGGNAAFAKMVDVLFSPETASIAPENLPALAKAIGLDETTFTTCLSSGKYAKRVERDFREGAGLGVTGTPFSIAWNKTTKFQKSINGAQPFVQAAAILESIGAKK